jgi:biotin carboxyl carrier protein
VVKGQVLLVLEAMKMENEIMAPADGVVQELNVNQGVSVNAGDVLVVLS